MLRVIIAAVVSALVMFAWGAFSWIVLPWHEATIQPLPDEGTTIATLSMQVPTTGVYYFPIMPEDPDPDVMNRWFQRHEAGPVGLLIYHKNGFVPLSWGTILVGFGLDLIAGVLVAWLVWLARAAADTFWRRMGVAVLLGVFATIHADLLLWNWMSFPTAYSMVNAADHFIGVILMSLPIAFLVKASHLNG